jgi:hypothetical protein
MPLSKLIQYHPFLLCIEQWYSTGGTHTPRGTQRHPRGYVKYLCSFINFYTTSENIPVCYLIAWVCFLLFKTYLIHSFGCNLFNL